MPTFTRVCGFCVGLLVAAAAAADSSPPERSANGLYYQLEIGKHQRLVRARSQAGAVLAPFVSDGCSGGLSIGWAFLSSTFPAIVERHGNRPPWENCCLDHDRLYHTGGPSEADADASFTARLKADNALRACVIDVGESRAPQLRREYGLTNDQVRLLYKGVADAMYGAVRLGGGPCSGLPWRWGFGWPQCR